MEQAFYRQRLEAAGIDVLTPNESQRDEMHRVIYEELCQGKIKPDSRHTYLDIVSSLFGNFDCL
jgi:aspartate racemase